MDLNNPEQPGLRQTRVPNPGQTLDEEQALERTFLPMRALASERTQKFFWMGIALVGFLVGAIAPTVVVLHYEQKMKERPYVFVLDAAGSIHSGPMERLNLRSEIFVTTALNATQAAMQRSPVGLDLPEVVGALFRADAATKLRKNVEEQMEDIRARQLHQKPEISQVTALSENAGVRVIEVRGQLIRAGTLDGTPIADPSIPFQLVLAIMQNPRMSERGQYPFIVTDLKFRVER